MGVIYNRMLGGYTPICEHCGICLCWDISEDEYYEDELFWDTWICKVCNGGQPLSLKEWRKRNVLGTTEKSI